LTLRRTIVRRRLAALIACCLIATILPYSAATAEYGIPAGSGAVITAGAPLAVRTAPGWDAEVSYDIADGSYVTVWGVEQAAPDGSMWYPVDGGFVPIDAVSSVAPQDGEFQLFQDAAPDAAIEGWVDPATGQWVEPAPADSGWVDPATGEWIEPAATTEDWVEPAPTTEDSVQPVTEGWVDPATGQWVEPAATTEEQVEPNLDQSVALYQEADPNALATESVDPAAAPVAEAPASGGWVDPATGQWVEPAPVSAGWVDPATGQWVEPAPADQAGWVDPATGQWVESAPADSGWVDPATGQWVEAAPTTELAQQAPAQDQELVAEPAPVDVSTEAAPATTSGPDPWGEPIGTAYISGSSGDGAICRVGADRGTDQLAVLAEGEAVEVRGEAVGNWQPVNCAGIGGYVNTSLIAWEPSAEAAAPVEVAQKAGKLDRHNNGNSDNVSVDSTTTSNGNSGNAGVDGTANSSGSEIANFAMQYVGYPYAYAGEGPYAFDCSGFTKFVIQNTLGMDITHDMFTQIGMGQSVGMDELQPGDLVFFANTFRPGLSHAGVYIGGGQFVHAENESTGVTVSDLNSDYYGSRWAGGTRLA
jgi:cell wall-associated NlpC family hydrolase